MLYRPVLATSDFTIRIGFGVQYTIIIIRNPQNHILIIKTLTLGFPKP